MAVPIDEGFIGYRAFLSALCAGGFKGRVAYEICSPTRDGGSEEPSIAMRGGFWSSSSA